MMDSQLLRNISKNDNTSIQLKDSDFLIVVNQVTGAVGLLAAFVNGVVLFYMSRLLVRKKNSFLIQLFLISLIDGGGGLVLFILPRLTVLDYTSLVACLVVSMFVLAFDCMSKGNILCICIQRFQFAINLRKIASTWKIVHTVSIVAVNMATGFLAPLASLMLNLSMVSFDQSVHYNRLCSPFSLNVAIMLPVVIMFVAGFMFLMASDICCVLTIRKLVKGPNPVYPVNSYSQSHPSTSSEGSVYLPAKKRQWHAIITICGMLVMFTLTSLPLIIATVLKILGFDVGAAELRLCLVVGYVTIIFNPLLIICRTGTIRNVIKEDMTHLLLKVRSPANL